MPKLNLLAGLLLLAGLITIAPAPVRAITAGGVGIVAARSSTNTRFFIYEANPGDVIEDTAKVSNDSDQPLKIKLEAVDATVLEGGGFGLLDTSQANPNLGEWVKLETDIVELAPHSSQLVNFTVTVPNDPEVGDHIGGLLAYKLDSGPDATFKSGGAAVNIRTRVGTRIYLTVLGDITRGFKLLGRSLLGRNDQMVLRFGVANLGNIRAHLEADVRIYGLFGRYDVRNGLDVGEIFPKKTEKLEIVWPGKNRPLFGPYLAVMTIRDTYKPILETSAIPPAPPSVRTWAIAFFIPYLQTIIVLVALFLFWFIRQLFLWLAMVRLARRPVARYRVKKGDHLMGIAAKYNVSWKLLARLNDIKPPYSLNKIVLLYTPDAHGVRRQMNLPNFLVYLTRPLHRFFRRRKLGQVIIVEKGDTKKDIEAFTGLTWAEIARQNGLKPTSRPRASQELKVRGLRKRSQKL